VPGGSNRVRKRERSEEPGVEVESAIAELQFAGRFEYAAADDVPGAGAQSESGDTRIDL
jgi:hypothetical protein